MMRVKTENFAVGYICETRFQGQFLSLTLEALLWFVCVNEAMFGRNGSVSVDDCHACKPSQGSRATLRSSASLVVTNSF